MIESTFVPYASLKRPDGRIDVHGHKILRQKLIKGGEAIISSEEVPVGPDKSNGPELYVDKKDGVIRAIEVLCSCGQKIRILCEYD